MLTLFTTAKPFTGHSGVIQRNALKSWVLLHPHIEVIVFGDDEGAADVARELGIRHEPHVERNEFGLKRVDYIFGRAQDIARHDTLCYVNCDIILTAEFRRAVNLVSAKYSRFLMVGRRWDTSITQPIDYSNPHWTQEVQTLALHENNRRDQWFIDYFVFSRGLYGGDIPPMGIGAIGWDNWLIWKALRSKSVVVDASSVVIAVHQNHDYSYNPQGEQGVWTGKEAMRNLHLAGGRKYLCNILHATRELTTEGGIRWTWLKRRRKSLSIIWHSLLELTYVPRHALGLSRQGIRQLRARIGARRTRP